MIALILSIIFSKALNFADFTLSGLLFWMNFHPFITIIIISNIIVDCMITSLITTSLLLGVPYDLYQGTFTDK